MVHHGIELIQHVDHVPRLHGITDIREANDIAEKERHILIQTGLNRLAGPQAFRHGCREHAVQQGVGQFLLPVQPLAESVQLMRRLDLRGNMLPKKHHVALEAMEGQVRHREAHPAEFVDVLGVRAQHKHGRITGSLDHVALELDILLLNVGAGDDIIKGHRGKVELLVGQSLQGGPIPASEDGLDNFQNIADGTADKIRRIPQENLWQRLADLEDLEVGVDHLMER